MGNRLIVQGDDRFAVFSTVVDNITDYDCTVEEMVAAARREAANKAEKEIRAWCAGPQPGRNHYTVEDAVEWVRTQHGDAEADKVRGVLNTPASEVVPTPLTHYESTYRANDVHVHFRLELEKLHVGNKDVDPSSTEGRKALRRWEEMWHSSAVDVPDYFKMAPRELRLIEGLCKEEGSESSE